MMTSLILRRPNGAYFPIIVHYVNKTRMERSDPLECLYFRNEFFAYHCLWSAFIGYTNLTLKINYTIRHHSTQNQKLFLKRTDHVEKCLKWKLCFLMRWVFLFNKPLFRMIKLIKFRLSFTLIDRYAQKWNWSYKVQCRSPVQYLIEICRVISEMKHGGRPDKPPYMLISLRIEHHNLIIL
jgi:hypothetical protein